MLTSGTKNAKASQKNRLPNDISLSTSPDGDELSYPETEKSQENELGFQDKKNRKEEKIINEWVRSLPKAVARFQRDNLDTA